MCSVHSATRQNVEKLKGETYAVHCILTYIVIIFIIIKRFWTLQQAYLQIVYFEIKLDFICQISWNVYAAMRYIFLSLPTCHRLQFTVCIALEVLPYLVLKLAGCGGPSYKDKKSYSSSTAKDWKTIWILFPSSATITQVQFAPFGYPYGNPGLSIVPFLPFKLPPHVWIKPGKKGENILSILNIQRVNYRNLTVWKILSAGSCCERSLASAWTRAKFRGSVIVLNSPRNTIPCTTTSKRKNTHHHHHK